MHGILHGASLSERYSIYQMGKSRYALYHNSASIVVRCSVWTSLFIRCRLRSLVSYVLFNVVVQTQVLTEYIEMATSISKINQCGTEARIYSCQELYMVFSQYHIIQSLFDMERTDIYVVYKLHKRKCVYKIIKSTISVRGKALRIPGWATQRLVPSTPLTLFVRSRHFGWHQCK